MTDQDWGEASSVEENQHLFLALKGMLDCATRIGSESSLEFQIPNVHPLYFGWGGIARPLRQFQVTIPFLLDIV